MDRRNFLRRLSVLLASAAPAALSCSKTGIRPNFLLITADDLHYASVGVFGCGVADITPNIDRLASEGVRFTNAHVNIAVCQPCRSVLMTGKYPHRNGAVGFGPIFENVPTLQERLRKAGYYNGIAGKVSHLTPEEKFCWDKIVRDNELGQGRDSALFYVHAKEFFEESKKIKKPFFLMANSSDPHRPFAGSEQEKHRAVSRNLIYPEARLYYKPQEIEVPGFLPDLPDVRKELAQYYTSTHRCDRTVGMILQALEESGQADQTMVTFLSDNGMAFPYAKTNCYLSSTKTPWIVRWPGVVEPGAVKTDLVSTVDFMPTILESAGISMIEGLDGESYLDLIKGRPYRKRNYVYTAFHVTVADREYPMRSLQDKKYGYIYNAWSDGETVFINNAQLGLTFEAMKRAAETDKEIADRVKFFQYRIPEELYDYERDPDALQNLVEDPLYRDELRRFRKELLEFMISVDDPLAEGFRSYLESSS